MQNLKATEMIQKVKTGKTDREKQRPNIEEKEHQK